MNFQQLTNLSRLNDWLIRRGAHRQGEEIIVLPDSGEDNQVEHWVTKVGGYLRKVELPSGSHIAICGSRDLIEELSTDLGGRW